MTHFFEKRDRWGHGRALWVLLAMVFVMPLACWSLKQIELKNDVENWLPADDPSAVVLRWYRDQFPVENRILVSWDDSSLNDPRLERFAERLEGAVGEDGIRRNGVKFVEHTSTPQDVLRRMVKYDVDPQEALRRLEGVLIGTGKLKVKLTEAGKRSEKRTKRSLVKLAKSKLGIELVIDEPAAEPFGPAEDTTGEGDQPDESDTDTDGEDAVDIQAILDELWRAHDFQVSWPAMHGDGEKLEQFRRLALSLTSRSTAAASGAERLVEDCFFAPGAPAAVSVTLSEAGTADRREAFRAIRQAAAEVGIDANTLRMAGRPVAGHQLNEEVKKAAWNRGASFTALHKRSSILFSCLVSVVLAFVMLRSVRLALLVLVVSFFTMLISVALVPATGGSMNMVLVVMPTLLLVLTMSAAIHVANYWKHAAYDDMQTAVVKAFEMAKVPCALASITTAIGLVSLTTSTLAPVRDFGLYAAVGCLISLLVVLFCLPALLQFWPAQRPSKSEVDRTGWQKLGGFLSRFSTRVTVSCLLLFAVCTYGLRYFRTETKVIRYFPDHSRVVQDYKFLEENLAGIIPVDTIVRFDQDAQDEINFFERMEVVRRIQDKMRQHPEISGTMSLADFQKLRTPPKQATGFRRLRYNKQAFETERKVKQEGSESHRFLRVASQPADLYKDGDQRLSKAGDELWRITAQVAIMSDRNYGDLTRDLDQIAQSELKMHAGAGHVVTGMVPIFLRTQQAVLESLIRSFGLAFGVIAVVMMVLLRNPAAGLIAMLPNLMPIGVIFGLISWSGWRVDIGTMITASVALGIAVDGTLHLLTWFRISIAQGKTRSEAVSQALGHCGPAMWQTSAAVGIGLAVLSSADLLLISRFGFLMAALIGTALLADIIFLPALLAGPLGRLIESTAPSPGPTSADAAQPELILSKPHLDKLDLHQQEAPAHSEHVLRVDD